ncbi:hypothetical protein [Streptomyces sp. NPDC096132]|uniref:hypothetical protein n=1 Tax=Streptomyces sp. NPDC096132 TaxID=3366075 RepID=UPI00380CA432
MTSSDQTRTAEHLIEKHRQAGLVDDEGFVRMHFSVNLIRTYMQLATRSDAYHRQYGWSWAGFRLLVIDIIAESLAGEVSRHHLVGANHYLRNQPEKLEEVSTVLLEWLQNRGLHTPVG